MSVGAFCIILAGGEGKRMRRPDRQKACIEVGGVPVILRSLRAYDEVGVGHYVIVVGHRAEQVLNAVGRRYRNVTFAFQAEPVGTGDAARCGARVLEDAGYEGEVLVVAGDKIVEPRAIHKLMDTFHAEGCDLAFLTDEKAGNPTLGRVLADDQGRPVAIVEVSEIRRAQVAEAILALAEGQGEVAGDAVVDVFHSHFPDRSKARKAGGALYLAAVERESLSAEEIRALLRPLLDGSRIAVRGPDGDEQSVSAADAEERAREVNLSIYLFRASALYESLAELSRENAQGEEFLTDTIGYLARARKPDGSARFQLASVRVDAREDLLTFNTPEELQEIERVLALREAEPAAVRVTPRGKSVRPVEEWRRILSAGSPELDTALRRIYGDDVALRERKRREHLSALDMAAERLGPQTPVFIIRSPGRINLLGRHIDHRGGRVNVMAISEEILMIAAPREDDHVHLYNTDPASFGHVSFSISGEIARLDWDDWLTCVNSPKTLAVVGDGHWGNYIKAAALRLQYEFGRRRLTGADIVTHGTIPVGSGLSSSSAVVVGAAEVLVAVNGLDIRPSSLVDLCGEGEWFVGTRGGSADHAAIKFAKRGQVAHVSFFPFAVKEFVPFPADHSLVVSNSGEVARKSQGARETFNSRVLGYLVGELIFKKEFPEFAPAIQHLRDINPENLGIELVDLYQMLKRVPVEIGERELLARYGPFSPEDTVKIGNLVSAISDRSRLYQARGQLIFGLAECDRAQLGVDLLRRGDAESLGRLWQISHDGDRVVRHDADLEPTPFVAPVDDAWLDGLATQLRSGDPESMHEAHLHRQPGVYGCSTPLIDRIVDIALRCPGVKGAQLAGAGLGGCAMILVQKEHVAALVEQLAKHGHETTEYSPVEGAGVVEL